MINISIIRKQYCDVDGPIIADCRLNILHGERVAIVGPSGCGKSTLLRVVAGLDMAFEGVVDFSRRGGDSLPSVGIVFQEPRLFPWMKVRANIVFGASKIAQTAEMVRYWVQAVGLQDSLDKWPHQLSGGMAQRVSFARTMISNPALLLLDEPFGALDYVTRSQLRFEFKRWIQDYDATVILVTHDIEEAVLMANRIFILGGRPSKLHYEVTVDHSGDDGDWVRRNIALVNERLCRLDGNSRVAPPPDVWPAY